MNGMKTVIIYSLETIYQTLINLKASFQGNGVIDDIKSSILLLSITTIYSRTSGKRPLKMQRLSGHLREMVAYKNLTTGGLFQEEVQTHLLYGRYFLHAMSKLRHVVVPCCHYSSSYIRSCIVHAVQLRDLRMHQVVANKRLKQWKIINHQAQKWSQSLTGGGRLLEVPTVSL